MEECAVCGKDIEFCPSCYLCQALVCGPDCLTVHFTRHTRPGWTGYIAEGEEDARDAR